MISAVMAALPMPVTIEPTIVRTIEIADRDQSGAW